MRAFLPHTLSSGYCLAIGQCLFGYLHMGIWHRFIFCFEYQCVSGCCVHFRFLRYIGIFFPSSFLRFSRRLLKQFSLINNLKTGISQIGEEMFRHISPCPAASQHAQAVLAPIHNTSFFEYPDGGILNNIAGLVAPRAIGSCNHFTQQLPPHIGRTDMDQGIGQGSFFEDVSTHIAGTFFRQGMIPGCIPLRRGTPFHRYGFHNVKRISGSNVQQRNQTVQP